MLKNQRYYFKEAQLPKEFCKDDITHVRNLIDSSTSFTVVGMPSVGISMFLKYLVCQNFSEFIHVDINDLSQLNRNEFLGLLLKELDGIPAKNEDLIIEHIKQQVLQ